MNSNSGKQWVLFITLGVSKLQNRTDNFILVFPWEFLVLITFKLSDFKVLSLYKLGYRTTANLRGKTPPIHRLAVV